jgi:hypothetical protein
MSRAADYRKWATECQELAQNARTPAQRTMLLHIADTWLRLAADADDDVQLDGVGNTSARSSMLM